MTDESAGIPGVAAASEPRREQVLRRNSRLRLYGPDIPAPFSFSVPPRVEDSLGKGQGRPIQSPPAEIKVTKEAGE